MACLGGVHEVSRLAGRGEGGRDLAADMTGFADAGDDHAPCCLREQFHRFGKTAVDGVGQFGQGFGFAEDDPPAGLQHRLGIGGGCTHGSGGSCHSIGVLSRGIVKSGGLLNCCPPAPGSRERRASLQARHQGGRREGAPRRGQCANMSFPVQPATSRRARTGRNSKHALASSVRPSRSSMPSSSALIRWR